jgi:hypothetical protein
VSPSSKRSSRSRRTRERSLIEAAADKLTRRQPQQGLGGNLRVGIPGLSVELAGDLEQSGLDHEQLVNTTARGVGSGDRLRPVARRARAPAELRW